MSARLEQLIEAYHDGTLDASGAQDLSAALRGDRSGTVREAIALTGLLGQVFTGDDAVVRSVRERIEGERSASALVRAVRQSVASHPRRSRRPRSTAWWTRAPIAALVAVAVVAVLWLATRPGGAAAECRVETVAAITVQRGATTVVVADRGDLQRGDRLTLTTKATLVWPDGSRLVFGPEAQAEITRPGPGPGCRLLVGAVTAEIAAQRPGLPFVIATPETRVEVLGTRFRVVAGARSTRVDLHEGLVQLVRAGDGRLLTLHPDEFAVVADGQEFIARSARTPPVAPQPIVAPPPAEASWSPLFATSGLAGWIQQHGMWSNDHGRVRGHDPHGGKARLLGRHPVADLELNCRLRITGAEFAEVQVGDYNWFVEIPANGQEWIQVEVRQRGTELTITADGVALPLQAGDGLAMRAGPLGFYVMPGGALEIVDARFRIPTAR